jgi:hypothetical protein
VTIHSSQSEVVLPWLDLFRTRCFGHIQDEKNLRALTNSTHPVLRSLRAGSEFAMLEDNDWLKFRVPAID